MAKNITLAIDEEILDKVRVIAAERKTTVNALVRNFLTELTDDRERRAEARRRLVDLIDKSKGGLEPGYVWNREELYEERLLPRHKHPDLRGNGDHK